MSQHLNIRIRNPIQQAVFIFAVAVFIMLVSKAGSNIAFPWLTSGSFLLFFAVANNVQSIFAEHYPRYVQQSIMSFLSLLVGLGLMARLMSGLSIFDEEVKYYRVIYITMIMAFFTLMVLCFLVRSLIDYMRGQDLKNNR